jgi:tetratricopeptide (TPR) repeat protein
VAAEMATAAERHRLGDDLILLAHLQIAMTDYGLGDFAAVEDRLPRCLGMLDRPVGQALRSQVSFFRALFEIQRGRYGAGVDHAAQAYEMFRRSRPAEAEVFRLAQLLMIGHDVGGLTDSLIDAVPTTPGPVGFALALQLYVAVILFDLGRRDDAIRRLPLRRGELPDRPLDYVTVFIDVAAAIAAVETDDVVAAGGLLERLRPWAGRWAAAGTAAGSLGLVDLTLARVHATLGHDKEATLWFTRAVEGHERVGAPAWLARSLLHQGRFRRQRGDDEAALASLERAAALADAFSLPVVARQVAAAL